MAPTPSCFWRKPIAACTAPNRLPSKSGACPPKSTSLLRWLRFNNLMPGWITMTARQLGSLAATVLIGGLLTATLVRTRPVFDSDERQPDPRLAAASRALIQEEHAANRDVVPFYARHMRAMLHGDFGV